MKGGKGRTNELLNVRERGALFVATAARGAHVWVPKRTTRLSKLVVEAFMVPAGLKESQQVIDHRNKAAENPTPSSISPSRRC